MDSIRRLGKVCVLAYIHSIVVIIIILIYIRAVGNLDDVRKIYKKASQQNTDWPERIFDAWEHFEHQYGTVDNFELAVIFIKKQMTIVAQRREKVSINIPTMNPFADMEYFLLIL